MYNVEENFTKYMKEIGSTILFSPSPGETIKKLRKGIEVNQGAMARLLDVRRETISRIETGNINPTSSFIKNFSKFTSIIKIFRDMNALRDGQHENVPVQVSPTFMRTHFSLSSTELEALMHMGNASYSKTKKKVLRRIRI